MFDFLKRKNVFDSLKAHVITGNYRHLFYLQHRAFFDAIAEREIKRHLREGKTILYAPTWRDYEKSSSFFDAIHLMIETLPDHYNLIVKLHPNLLLLGCNGPSLLVGTQQQVLHHTLPHSPCLGEAL